MLRDTLDYAFKLLFISELDNDDVTIQVKTNLQTSVFANELWCSVKGTLVASDEIRVNVMQKSVVYWKCSNVVDIYFKRADAIKNHSQLSGRLCSLEQMI